MPNASIAELTLRVDRLLRIIRLLNRMYSARSAAEIDDCERELRSLLQEIPA